MLIFNTSEISGLKYYWVRSPKDVLYRPSSEPGVGEGRAEVALTTSVWLFNKSLNYSIWQGISHLEPQIIKRMREQKGKGALIVAHVFASKYADPNVGVPQRFYKVSWIEGVGNDIDQLVRHFDTRDRIFEAKPNFKSDFYLFWATHEDL